jgi:hypothetical protein
LSSQIDLGLRLVDHQLLDVDGRRCGNVDELALEGGPGEPLEVVAIMSGPGAWRDRGVIGRLAGRVGRGGIVRIPWQDVETVSSHVKLRRRAQELGLGRGDDRLRPYVDRIPGADR